MSCKRIACCGVVALLTWTSVQSLDGQTRPTNRQVLYEGARLIPGDGKPAIERSAFLVENGTITRVGRAEDVKAPAGATRVDLTGKTVMPLPSGFLARGT